jgi:L-lactate dehydrogenase complex protein LldG
MRMATSRDTILTAIRNTPRPEAALPPLEGPWTTYANRRQQFAETLASVAGSAISVADTAQLNDELRRLPVYVEARKIVSLVEGVGDPNVDLEAVDDPHDLADVDVAILPGEFGVAENGAVWVTDRGVRWRAVYYICQHLVLVLPASQIVDNMHAAYARLQAAGQGPQSAFAQPMFGAFISGPSKTADIEQALVIGAHGPRSLTVFLVGE